VKGKDTPARPEAAEKGQESIMKKSPRSSAKDGTKHVVIVTEDKEGQSNNTAQKDSKLLQRPAAAGKPKDDSRGPQNNRKDRSKSNSRYAQHKIIPRSQLRTRGEYQPKLAVEADDGYQRRYARPEATQ